MDPSKAIGKIKEQVKLENISRRRYPDKWGKLTDKDVNRFYNQNEVNKSLCTTGSIVNKEIWPYKYTGYGDSYFVSKDMYESLVAKCRCGRRRTEGHTIKCLQKVKSKYLNDDGGNDSTVALPPSFSFPSIASGDNSPGKGSQVKYDNEAAVADDSVDCPKSFKDPSQKHDVGNSHRRIPETSNGMVGWRKSGYNEWEQSTKYISPMTTMHGYKVTERPYSVIFIG